MADKAGKPEKAVKPKKKAAEAAPVAVAAVAVAPVEVAPKPVVPVDYRLKVMKKFKGRFLPKGPLRERLKVIMEKWNADESHSGVNLEELKSLLADWRSSRVHPKKAAAAAKA